MKVRALLHGMSIKANNPRLEDGAAQDSDDIGKSELEVHHTQNKEEEQQNECVKHT
ncbi:unnamed protein product [Sphenostylis stenocarpa]|uniref:Uncharacterized protein n=1 Tax=Sphenostylis stenocarpa TaxID=92480 RepID=A0AA86S6U6_9FABA|nr:unnamed protein product [Sphenostylis stenocarpa]